MRATVNLSKSDGKSFPQHISRTKFRGQLSRREDAAFGDDAGDQTAGVTSKAGLKKPTPEASSLAS